VIELALARKFIEQVAQYTDYNINIMNEQGIIIASRDPGRIGSFHEVAYYIVTSSEDVVLTSDEEDYPGVRPGINMVINLDGKREGVVGITGKPEEVKPIAMITKMAIEAMLKYEMQQIQRNKRLTRKERFLTLLTHEEYSDPSLLRSIARELNYSENLVRIPILCHVDDVSAASFLDMIKLGECHSPEDISFVLDDEHILIFKTIPEQSKLFADYKYVIAEYLSHALQWIRRQDKNCKFYIGSFQESFSQYYYAYMHCKWLEETVETKSVAAFFYDHTGDYMRSMLSMQKMQQMYNVYADKLGEEFLSGYVEIMGALIRTNYNLAEASRRLFMHKNTLLYRYNKIKDTLNANPIADPEARYLLEGLYCYLTKEHQFCIDSTKITR